MTTAATRSAGTGGTTRQAQRALIGLLGRPLVTPRSDSVLHRLVVSAGSETMALARRLGYRVQIVGRAVRLVRLPLAGQLAAPPAPLDAAPRRVLTLVCCLAAACEDTDGAATLQRLSDLVRDITNAPRSTVTGYDPDSRTQRLALVRAAEILEHWGVLVRRAHDDRVLDQWVDGAGGVGTGYDIDRDALLLLSTPDVFAAALDTSPPDPDQLSSTRAIRALRTLVETPAILYAQLPDDEADMLRATRGLRATDAAAITGGVVEARAEGLVLLMADDEPCPVTVDWPRAATGSWVSLLAADLAGRAGVRQADGTVHLSAERVEDVIADLLDWRGEYMSIPMRNPTASRDAAQRQLTHLGLLQVTDLGGWVLSPVAGRYRDPDVTLPETVPGPATSRDQGMIDDLTTPDDDAAVASSSAAPELTL